MPDILIRGMEMPNVGEKIEFTQNIAGRIYAKFNPSKGYICEVIELPEHGDLISKRDLENIVGEPLETFLSRLDLRCPPTAIPSNKEESHTMDEFMYGQEGGSQDDGSL